MIYFIVFEINVFPHKFPIAWENPVKSTKLRDPGKLVPIFSPTYGYFIPSDSYLMLYLTTWEMQGFLHQFLTAREDPAKSIPGHLRLFFRNTVARTCSKI